MAIVKRWSVFRRAIIFTLVIMGLPAVATANSSWHWISQTRPWDVLPYVIFVTLLIEIMALVVVTKARPVWKVFLAVLFANLISFVTPYLLEWLFVISEPGLEGTSFFDAIERNGFYTVGLFYIIITLVAEVPIVYNILKKNVGSRERLSITIFCSNIMTTLITAIVERALCWGEPPW